MGWLKITTEGHKAEFQPGETVVGSASWKSDGPATLEVRLFWYTRGKGTEDVELVQSLSLNSAELSGSQDFRFLLPEGPYSFSGKLISVMWAIELVSSSGDSDRVEMVVSPTRKEIILPEKDQKKGQ